MKKSIMFATMLVVGAGATGAAALPSPYSGSDTLFDITRAMITSIGTIGPATNYVGGGSGNGQSAMANGGAAEALASQQTAPMSKMMTNGNSVCLFNGGTAGSLNTHASGIVIGLDAVDVLSSKMAGGQQIAACNLLPNGAAASGTTGVFAGTGTQNWKWILALVYGGKDSSAGGVTDCNSPARQNLVNNWGNLIQGGACTLSSTVQPGSGLNAHAACTDATHLGAGDGVHQPLWHAFRRDEASGTSDVFASLLGLSPSTSNSAVNGFGTSPYCNAMNWDTSTGNANCANPASSDGLNHDQFTGPGGIIDPLSVCNIATGVCTGGPGSGTHRKPPTGSWGDFPDPSQTTNAADVFPTEMQDNDPIRRPCIGGTANVHARAGEEVCNLDNKLGLVLPMVDSDWIASLPAPNNLQYPTNGCTGFATGKPPTVFSCAPRGTGTKHSGECPNGDALNGGACGVPIDATDGTSQCVASASTVDAGFQSGFRTLTNNHGRVYNLHMRDGTITGNIGYMEYPVPATNPPSTLDFVGAFNRIHQVETILGNAAPGCQMVDMTDQIGCLTASDPCSIGYAGDASKTWTARANGFTGTNSDPFLQCSVGGAACTGEGTTCNTTGTCVVTWETDSLNIGLAGAAVAANLTNVQKLGTPNEYQLSRKLYFNSLRGFDTVGVSSGDTFAADELTLADNEASITFMDGFLSTYGFFPLGSQVLSAAGNLCEDFNEHTVCSSTAANVNGCLLNPAPIPGALANSSVVCGDGVIGPFEECDGTVRAGTGGCSSTCRCNLDYNSATTSCN